MKIGFVIFLTLIALVPNALAQDDQNPCAALQAYHIVVLGSSTAAGTGPSSSDSTWVNRFKAYQQSIHPGNQVTNLAIGGTTTYHIMPTGFVPPTNRPNPNPLNNVTQAIALQADAIIVNMPSNDAANNFTVQEQVSNFQTIVSTAATAGIPVWVCTTQPRTSFGAAQNAIQTQVRDSVLAIYGPRAIDFWNPFANANLDIDPIYDSGDGVHLNDFAHGLLFQKVKAEEVLGSLFDTLSTVDHAILDFSLVSAHPCGDSLTKWRGVVTNLGPASVMDLQVSIPIEDLQTTVTNIHLDTLFGGIGTCEADTFWVTENTYAGADLALKAMLLNSGDQNLSNDTSVQLSYSVPGYPQLTVFNDTNCFGDLAMLQAFSNLPSDTVFWYDNVVGGPILQGGSSFSLGSIIAPETRFAAAVRGPLYYSDSLETVTTTTTNWNGVMFDIVAQVPLTIDSLRTRINSTGLQGVVGFMKGGSHLGSQNTPAAWQVWGSDVLTVANAGDFKVLHFPPLVLQQGDTVGVYLYMQQSSATLSYRSSAAPGNFSSNELSVLTGSGISHTFTNLYYPRHWAGELYYHYGFAEMGTCASPRQAVAAEISEPEVDLGSDTVIYGSDSLILVPDQSFSTYFWSTGSLSDTLQVDQATFGLGPSVFWVEVTDEFDCIARDTVLVTIMSDTLSDGVADLENAVGLRLFPNPNAGVFQLEFTSAIPNSIAVYDPLGKVVINEQINTSSWSIDEPLRPGIYQISLQYKMGQLWRKVVVY